MREIEFPAAFIASLRRWAQPAAKTCQVRVLCKGDQPRDEVLRRVDFCRMQRRDHGLRRPHDVACRVLSEKPVAVARQRLPEIRWEERLTGVEHQSAEAGQCEIAGSQAYADDQRRATGAGASLGRLGRGDPAPPVPPPLAAGHERQGAHVAGDACATTRVSCDSPVLQGCVTSQRTAS